MLLLTILTALIAIMFVSTIAATIRALRMESKHAEADLRRSTAF